MRIQPVLHFQSDSTETICGRRLICGSERSGSAVRMRLKSASRANDWSTLASPFTAFRQHEPLPNTIVAQLSTFQRTYLPECRERFLTRT